MDADRHYFDSTDVVDSSEISGSCFREAVRDVPS